MPQKRQAAPDPEADIAIRSLALKFPRGHRVDTHEHPWSQLIYATRGVMTVETESGTWVVPSHRAAWVPEGVRHGIEMSGIVALRTLYLRPGLALSLPTTCCVMHVSPLLRELIVHVVATGYLDEAIPEQARLVGVVVDQLVETPEMPLNLPLPADPRARRVAEHLRQHPATTESHSALAQGSGASLRTLERLFRRETGMTLGRWRQQVRLMEALRRLAEGATVTTVALELGYESTSAFIAMFKRTLGKTPGRYYEAQS